MNPQGVIEQLQDWANLLFARSLALDPICARRLADLAGQSIEVACAQPDITWHADITDGGIEVRLGPALTPNVQLRGSATELLKRALANDTQAAVEVNGDETLLLELVAVLSGFRPDIAPMLAKLIGDTRAQSVTALFELGADSALKFARSQIQEVQQASERTMSQNFTGTKDMNQLQDQLDQLRLQINRVDARIHQLEEAKRHGA
ncbi:MAG: hypothetical protein GWP50_02150 [Proteobacteria bacterium]|nr:hypothetical protein [Pseudomonadota bacterium]